MNPNDQIKHAAATEIDAGPGGTGLMGLVDEYRELKHISAQVGVMRAAGCSTATPTCSAS
jgi:hypothetical protein